MKLAKRDIAILLIVFGLIAAFCSYKFILSPSLDTVEEENSQQESLQAQIDEVKQRADQESKMKQDISDWSEEIATAIGDYKAAYLYEDGVLYIKDLSEQDFAPVIETYNVGETAYGTIVTGQGSFAGTVYSAGSATYSFDYEVESYTELKEMVAYLVSGSDGVKTIDTLTASKDGAEGKITGSVTMSAYVLTDSITNPYAAPDTSVSSSGISDIFENAINIQ